MKNRVKVLFITLLALTMTACSKSTPMLKGFYQSEMIGSNIVQISIDAEENKFVEYITNHKVNQGTYVLEDDGTYKFDGDELDFSILLNDDNSFEITLPKLNKEEPMLLKNISNIPTSFATEFDDNKEYKKLIK